MKALLVIGVLVFSTVSAFYYDPDCVRGLPGPPGPPGSIGSIPPCRYIGTNGECYTMQGVFDEEDCKRRFGEDQYELWRRRQQSVDYMTSHSRFYQNNYRP